MYDVDKMYGKYSYEYFVHLFRCLQKYGSSEDHFIFYKDAEQRIKVSHDERSSLLRIEVLVPMSKDRLQSVVTSHNLNLCQKLKSDEFHHAYTSSNCVDIAGALMLGDESLLNQEDLIGLESKNAKGVFAKSMDGSQFVVPPFLSIGIAIVWGGHELVRFILSDMTSFSLRNFDLVEWVLFLISCYFYSALRVNKSHIPIFREGSCQTFLAWSAAIRGLKYWLFILVGISLITS